jgi:hypothetical protein
MFKQFFSVFFILIFTTSCAYFENKSKHNPIQKVDTIINFNSVDAFPLFPNCKDIPSRKKQQICFQMEMSQHIYAALKQYSFQTKEAINDTIFVELIVNSVGKTSLSSLQISKKTQELLPEFDSIVKVSLQNLPKLQPAIKRNMPVTTAYTLPIILKN